MPKDETGTRTVLVVDDNDDIRELIRFTLEMKGYQVVEAGNGQEAVELAARMYPAIILMDLSMPVLDGYEATRRILAQPALSSTPIVAVSGHCDVQNMEKALEAGCIECISKPVDFSAVLEIVSRHLKS